MAIFDASTAPDEALAAGLARGIPKGGEVKVVEWVGTTEESGPLRELQGDVVLAENRARDECTRRDDDLFAAGEMGGGDGGQQTG